MEVTIALLAAAIVGYLVYNWTPVAGAYWVARAKQARMRAEERKLQLPAWAFFVEPLRPLARYTPRAQLEKVAQMLYWCQFEGSWMGWDAPSFCALQIAGAAIMGAFSAAAGSPLMAVVAAFAGFFIPRMMISSRAARVKREFRRALPEKVQLLAQLASVGKPVRVGLRCLAEGKGPVARWLKAVLAGAHGRPLFSSPGSEGVLLAEARRTGLEEVAMLATQLDLIHARGAGARELLQDVARSISDGYTMELKEKAGRLGSELVLPELIFYFIPYLLAIMAPIAAAFIGGVIGGGLMP